MIAGTFLILIQRNEGISWIIREIWKLGDKVYDV
jgi:hypothetical protein